MSKKRLTKLIFVKKVKKSLVTRRNHDYSIYKFASEYDDSSEKVFIQNSPATTTTASRCTLGRRNIGALFLYRSDQWVRL